MILVDLLGFLPIFFGTALQPSGDTVVRRVVIQEQLVIGVPLRPRVTRPVEWVEKKGPKCISGNAIAGALLSSDRSIDFLLTDRTRVRAKLEDDCPALDFYSRIYLQPDDGRICAGRDTVRSRIGGVCQIDRFKTLKPRLKN